MIQKIGSNIGINNVNNTQANVQNKTGFGEYLKNALNEVNKLELEADNLTKRLAAGEDIDLHTVMIATEKANIALQMTVQVRNKAVEAYTEIMRMQV